MTHSDDKGLVLPPKLAPYQVVIVPIFRSEEDLAKIKEYIKPIQEGLAEKGIRVHLDDRDQYKPGYKFTQHEVEGVPVRIAVGMRDVENGKCEIARRDLGTKIVVEKAEVVAQIDHLMVAIQQNLFDRAKAYREEMSTHVDDFETFQMVLDTKGGFIYAHWDGTAETETKIKELTKATIRCIPLNNPQEKGKCVYSGKESTQRVIFAKSY
jgi:prolyl-tRNA synthetase